MSIKGRIALLIGLFTSLCISESTSYGQFQQQWTAVRVLPQREAEFRQALREYVSENYRSAYAGFESLCSTQELHQRMTASLLMTGKSLYQMGQYADAIPYFTRLINTFPRSNYIDDAYYAQAQSYYRLSEYDAAVKQALYIADHSRDPVLSAKSKRLAAQIMRNHLSVPELYNFLQSVNGEHSVALVTIELAKKEIYEGSASKAIALLRDYKERHRSRTYASAVDRLIKEAENPTARPVRVGVILPLTGYYSEEGRSVLRGIRFAHSESKKSEETPIQLEVWDSESNMVKAIQGVDRLTSGNKAHSIIGELESSITAGIGALASAREVSVVAPAATENGVAAVGDGVFQLNSSLETKGQAIAEYAFNVLGLRTFATLAPADEYGQQMINSFTSKIDELGGRIIAQQWFYAGSNELNLIRQFANIRESAFIHDSTDVEKLLKEAKDRGEDLDEKDIPVRSIDGIFFPIYSENIPYVAPQFALSNIRAQVLGGEYWDDIEILSRAQVQPYINGCIFVSDYFPDEQSRQFREFRTEFRLAMKATPERWEVFGYDALNVLREAMRRGAKTAGEIRQTLGEISDYQGIKGEISFKGHHRVNSEVNVLQFINGRVVRHQSTTN